ncbi:MAG: ion transporter [Rhizobiales bacterium]|nr:cyclic nucleotide-gated ion channel/potassium channel family protein [Hyphomicrobiales bacterium]NRB13808.1 ion transporter [Hyphomicrobiales bacterium]
MADVHKSIRYKTYILLEVNPANYLPSKILNGFLIILIIANVIAFAIGTVDSLARPYGSLFEWFNIFSVAIFSVEYLTRLWCAVEYPHLKHVKPFKARIGYMFRPIAFVDLVSILPFYLGNIFGLDLRGLRILRLLRILKLARYSPAIETLGRTVYNERRALWGALIIMICLILFSSTIMYLIEKDVQPDDFGSIPAAAWWAVSTLTTIGYGDAVPMTAMGKFVGGVFMMLGLGMFALPIGILATGFSQETNRRQFVISWGMVSRVPVFHGLNAETISNIMSMLKSRTYSKNEIIFKAGDPAEQMFFITLGSVKVETEEGVFELKEGNYFGEIALLEDRIHGSSVAATTQLHVLELDKNDFQYLLSIHPEINQKMREEAMVRQNEVAAAMTTDNSNV